MSRRFLNGEGLVACTRSRNHSGSPQFTVGSTSIIRQCLSRPLNPLILLDVGIVAIGSYQNGRPRSSVARPLSRRRRMHPANSRESRGVPRRDHRRCSGLAAGIRSPTNAAVPRSIKRDQRADDGYYTRNPLPSVRSRVIADRVLGEDAQRDHLRSHEPLEGRRRLSEPASRRAPRGQLQAYRRRDSRP